MLKRLFTGYIQKPSNNRPLFNEAVRASLSGNLAKMGTHYNSSNNSIDVVVWFKAELTTGKVAEYCWRRWMQSREDEVVTNLRGGE